MPRAEGAARKGSPRRQQVLLRPRRRRVQRGIGKRRPPLQARAARHELVLASGRG